VPEQLFVNEQNPGEAISADKALQKANAQGQRIYHLTQANQATVLPNIHHHPDTMDEIKNALNTGQEVITHTDAVSVPGWTGACYIITDPVTGDGAYKISGGANGSFLLGVSIGLMLMGLFIASVVTTGGAIFLIGSVLASIGINAAFLSVMQLDLSDEEFDWRCFVSGLFTGISVIGLFYMVPEAGIWGAIMTALSLPASFSPNFVGPLTCLGIN
jgi:hypothetical protein